MLQIQNDNILIPIAFWNELKSKDSFKELISIIEDRQDLIELQSEETEFFDFKEYDSKRIGAV